MVPTYLTSTWELLRRAFPEGIREDEYLAVLENLYPHMCDENIVLVMVEATGKPSGLIQNDVYAVGAGMGASAEAVLAVREKLNAAGFEQWQKEEP